MSPARTRARAAAASSTDVTTYFGFSEPPPLPGMIGALGACALTWVFLDRVIELPPDLPFAALPVAALATAFLASLAGLLASTRALTSRPIESLRG